MKQKKLSQSERVYQYLKKHGSITNAHAILNMGIWRLGARINDLKKKNRIIINYLESDYVKNTKNYRYVAEVL